MIRHVVCLTFTPESTPEQREAARTGLNELPDLIPEIRAYSVGADLDLAEGNADLAIVADFATIDDYRAYATHPRHEAVVAERIRPIVAARVAAQIELPS